MTTGYGAFLAAMMRTPDAALAKADPQKLADKYQVPIEFAVMSLAHWAGRAR